MDISPLETSAADQTVATTENSTTGTTSEAKQNMPMSGRRWSFIECALITLAVLLFCAPFLDLGSPTRLPGNEAEVFQILDWTLVNSLRQHGNFPLWNPYLHTGLPYVADPLLHVYNPVVSVPVLLLGVLDGFKVAVFLSFLIGALG